MEWDRVKTHTNDLLAEFGIVSPTCIHTYLHIYLTVIYIYIHTPVIIYLTDYLTLYIYTFVLWSWRQFWWWCAEKSTTSWVTKRSKQSLCSLVKANLVSVKTSLDITHLVPDNSLPLTTHCIIDKFEWSRVWPPAKLVGCVGHNTLLWLYFQFMHHLSLVAHVVCCWHCRKGDSRAIVRLV